MKKVYIGIIILGLLFVSGCKICNEKFDACDYSVRPPKCASSFDEAKDFCKTLASDCTPFIEFGKWRCLCPSECG